MARPDFIVNISKLTRAIEQRGFGLPMILGTSGDRPYTLYNSISEVAGHFGIHTKEYRIAQRIFGQNPSPPQVAVFSILPDPEDNLADLLLESVNEVVETHDDWYYLTCTENTEEVVRALGGWAETQIKTYWTTTQDLGLVKSLEYENTIVMYHDNPHAYVAEGLVSTAATNDPGSLTFKFKGVQGVTAADIRSTDLTELHRGGGFSYIRKKGLLQTTEGTVTTGEYIDLVMAGHWIKVRMEEEAALLAVNTKKIHYDSRGIAKLVSVVDKVLHMAGRMGIIRVDDDGSLVYRISYLRREEVLRNDVANRVYNGIRWEIEIAGAIHSGTISGYFVI
ncbi:MAG: DUF3383 domain-containing protein [Defluviitaleaceae bacterium]|nr:DUF3383 domain-containing protein [Defluviitaleaceae bacterium]